MRIIKEKEEVEDEKPQRFWLFGPSFVQSPAKVKQEEEEEEEEEGMLVETSVEKSPLLFVIKKRPRSASKKLEPLKKIRVENPRNSSSSSKIKKGKPVKSTIKMKKDKNGEMPKAGCGKSNVLVHVKSEKGEDNDENNDGSTGSGVLSIVKMESDVNAEVEDNGVAKEVSGKRVAVSKKRWTKERYSRAEEVVMNLMRESGESRLPRRELREMARKHIGDTGLLDHLLKHMAGTIVGDRGERFMRGYNEEGIMFYWLESGSNGDGRNGMGICRCAEEIKMLKEGIVTLNRDLKELQTSKELEDGAWKEKYERLLGTNRKVELEMSMMKSSVQELKDKYETLQEKNMNLEAEMAGVGISSQVLKGDMLKQKKNVDEMAEEIEMVGDAKRDSDSEGGMKKNVIKQLNEHPNAFGSSQMRRPHLILALRGQVMC